MLVLIPKLFNAKEKIIVGSKSSEPFAYIDSDSVWRGLSFDLFNHISEKMDYEFVVHEYDLEGLIKAIEQKKIDIAVAPLTITSERETRVDFSHPYFIAGLGIAVKASGNSSLWLTAKKIFSVEFFEAVGLLAFVLFLIGFITWLFERKKNAEQFGDGFTKGLGSSFWWAAVTMTTVGYGDKSPKTVGGRLIALVWMFAAIIIISSFTAAIASSLTVTHLESSIKGVNDLYSVHVGAVEGSASEEFLDSQRIAYSKFESVEHAISALTENRLDAVVHDAPILKFLIKEKELTSEYSVLPNNLEPIYYGFAYPTGSKLREPINHILLEKVVSREWRVLKYKYFGE